MGWVLASEGFDGSGANAVPDGRGHAVDLQAGTTACGRPVRSLRLWRDIPWRRAGMLGLERCPVCDHETWSGE